MTARLGQLNHEGSDPTIAIAVPEPDGNGLKVVSFPEPGGTYAIDHNVPDGRGDGEFSSI